MPPKFRCHVKGCNYFASTGSTLFPQEPDLIRKWLDALKLDGFKPSWRVCFKHFPDSDFKTLNTWDGSVKKRLLPGAVPSLHLDTSVVSVAL